MSGLSCWNCGHRVVLSDTHSITANDYKRPLSKHTLAATTFSNLLRGNADVYIYKLLTQRPGTDPVWQVFYGVESHLIYYQWILKKMNFKLPPRFLGDVKESKASAMLELAREAVANFFPEVVLQPLRTHVDDLAAAHINRWRGTIQDCKVLFFYHTLCDFLKDS